MDLFTWSNAGVGALLVLGLVSLVVVARLFRSGLGTYDERHSDMERRIRKTEAEIRERNKALPLAEQLDVLAAALDEMLDLEGRPEGFASGRTPGHVFLETPMGRAEIRLLSRSATLRANNRVLRGPGRWEVCGPGQSVRAFCDLGQLMRCLAALVRGGEASWQEEPLPPAISGSFPRGRAAMAARARGGLRR